MTAAALPQPLTSLIGRERDVAAVVAVLREDGARLVTLTGLGGTGKTRLAIQVATEVSERYSDGVWFVSLAPVGDPDLVVSTIAQALGIREAADQPLTTSLTTALGDRRMLLVLDNFEQVVGAAPLLSELVGACRGLSILVTSRTPLHLYGEWAIVVPPLTVPDASQLPSIETLSEIAAVRLFVMRAQAAQSTFALAPDNARAVADICLRVDGLPLAIELAAARIRLLTPQALAERLEHRLPLLVDGPRDVPVRQQTLRATIAWSYDLLQPAEQLLLRRLSILKGGWTLDAAEALVAGMDSAPADILSSLATLIEHSLIQGLEAVDGSARFSMLETIREFGLEQLEIAGEVDEAHRRLVHHLLVVFSDSESDWHTLRADGWLRLGVAESDNVRLALEWATTNDPETGLRLARAFAWIWFVRGAVPESQHWLELGLANAGDVPDDLRADTRWWIGANAATLGAYAYARAAHEESLAIYGDLDNGIGAANCLHGLGRIAQFAGDSEQAVKLYEAASNLMRQHHAPRLMVTLSNLGLALLHIDKMDRASAVLDEAMELAEQHGLAWHRAQILGAQGSVALARGDLPGARRILQRSIRLSGDAGDPRFIAQELENAAWLATTEGAAEQAARLLGAVRRLRETIGVPISASTQRDYDRYVPVIQQQLSPSDWERARIEGHALSQAEAIDVALNGLADESVVSPAPTPTHSRLSQRELDVLRLLVEGKSDREIAAELFISHHTVMRHVSNILGKLGVESRTAAATYAMRHDFL